MGDLLTRSASATDADGGSPSISYSWTNGRTSLGSGSTLLLSAANTDPGDTLTCTVVATDTSGGTDTGSAGATVQDTAPAASTISLGPSGATAGDDLTCLVTGLSSDADGDSISDAFDWEVNGVAYLSATFDDPRADRPGSDIRGLATTSVSWQQRWQIDCQSASRAR